MVPFELGLKQIVRATLSFPTLPATPGMDADSGLGDLNVFDLILVPTGVDALVGAAAAVVWTPSAEDLFGALVTWQTDVAGDGRDHAIPIGIGVGKVIKLRRLVVNMFIEPQLTVLHDGLGQPELQVFGGINLQRF